jgi:DNA-binding NarL/FixJ family response regulator
VASPETVTGLRYRAPRPVISTHPAGGAQIVMSAGTATGAPDPLMTTEEVKILALLANGLAIDSVAVRVQRSPRTVRRRLRAVCDRLGVASPIQAVVWAARRGLI